jgi:Ca-activated chloride channel family protein
MATEKFSSRPIGEVTVDIDIRTDQPIRSVYCPSVTMDVRRPSPAHVIARWSERDILPTRDLSLFYECSADAVGGTLLSHVAEEGQGGYALVLVSPDPTLTQADSPPKDVVIVFDHSGSMAGEKMRQTRRAVNHILNHLAPEDRFNVVPYCDIVEPLYDGLVPADRSSIEQATAAVDRIEARGGTAIDDALAAAFDCFIPPRYRTGVPGEDRSAYVLFITDGRPTVGETDIQKILRRATRDNNNGARVLAFGVGYDVNVRLLDLLADQNRGRSLYVKPNEPIDAKVTSLYEKIRRPVMTDLSVAVEGVRLRDGYPRRVGDLYAGDQIVIAARYDADRAADLPGRGDRRLATLVVRGRLQGRTRRFEYPVSLEVRPQRGPLGRDFVEKLWATRRVGYLMDQIQLHGRSDEVVEEIVRLSKQYGIMTPYTSFLADETTALSRRDEVMGKAGANMDRLRRSEIGDVAQRDAAMRQQLNDSSAPAEMAFRKADQPAGATPMVGNTTRQAYEADREEKVAGVRQVGNQALYRRGQVMIAANAADLDPRRDRAKVQVVQRYSRDYFELVRANTAAENQVLASQRDDEQLLIRLRGQAYLIE